MTFRTVSGKLPCKTEPSRINYLPNPACRSASGTVEVRRNYALNPTAANTQANWAVYLGSDTTTVIARVAGLASPAPFNTAVRATYTAGQVSAGVGHNNIVFPSDGTYTVSFWVLRESGTLPLNLAINGVASKATAETLPIGTWVRCSFTTTVTARTTGVGIRGDAVAAPDSGSFLVTGVLVEQASWVGNYFDGSSPAGDGLTFLWTNGAYASASAAMGPVPVGWGGTTSNLKFWRGADMNSIRALLVSGTSGTLWMSGVTVAAGPGEALSGAALVSSPDAGTSAVSAVDWYNGASYLTTGQGATTSLNATGVRALAEGAIAPASTTKAVYTLSLRGAAGNNFTVAQGQFVKAATAATFFNGSTYESATNAYRWQGTADNSASEEVAKYSPNLLSIDGVTWRSLGEVPARRNRHLNPRFLDVSGTAEVRRNYCRNPSMQAQGNDWATLTNPLVVDVPWSSSGKAYQGQGNGVGTFYVFSPSSGSNTDMAVGEVVTVSATIVVPAGCAYRFMVHAQTGNYYYDNTTPLTPYVVSDGNPVRVTKTATLNSSGLGYVNAALLVYANSTGTPLGAGVSVQMSDVLVEKARQVFPYFDGNTAKDSTLNLTASWTGTAGYSPSILSGPKVTNNTLSVNPTYAGACWQASASGGMWIWHRGASYTVPNFYFTGVPVDVPQVSWAFYATPDKDMSIITCPQFGGVAGRVFQTVALSAGVRTLVTGTAQNPYTVNTGTVSVMIGFHPPGSNGTAFEGKVLIENLIFTTDGQPLPFFDGATAADSDYSYSWSGAANKSEAVATP